MSKILAVVATSKDMVVGGGPPAFITPTAEEQEKVAFLLEKILDASAHNLKNGLFIIVDHKS